LRGDADMKLAAYLGVLAIVVAASRQAAAQQEPTKEAAADPGYKYAIGVTGSFVNENQLSAGVTASYAPRRFCAFGGELSQFVLAGGGDSCLYGRFCWNGGTTVLPFGELRTPWPIPVGLFMRVSLGPAFMSGNDGSHKVFAAVRAAAGAELQIWPLHVYLRPFACVANKLDDAQRVKLGFGAEIGAVF
jgi:hypothetical protein